MRLTETGECLRRDLQQAELVEACAPLINPSKGSSPPAGPPGGQGGAGVAPGAVGGKGALPAPVPAQSNDPKKDAVKESKDGKGGKGGAGKDKVRENFLIKQTTL